MLEHCISCLATTSLFVALCPINVLPYFLDQTGMSNNTWLLVFRIEQTNWRNGGQTATATERIPQVGLVRMFRLCT